MSLKGLRNLFLIATLAVASYGVGYGIGHHDYLFSFAQGIPSITRSSAGYSNTAQPAGADLTMFWDVWNRLSQIYVDKKALDSKKMIYGAISGMVASLGDPYTVFLTPNQNKETKEELGGSFEGIGAQLGIKDKKIVVIAPLPDTPAQKAGVKTGDWILTIDKKPTDNLTLPEAVSKIRGQRGTKVTIQVLHEKDTKPTELTIVRDTILVKSVTLDIKYLKQDNNTQTQGKSDNNKTADNSVEIKDNGIAYIRLSRFGDDTDREWDNIVAQLKSQEAKLKGIILDLRNNPGGYLNGAVYIASEFLKPGDTVVIQQNGNGERQNYSVEREGKLQNVPLVVLINEGSASASEIVSGALLDYKRATLVGMKSFGKGSVQEAQDLSEGAGIHITTAKWLLPKGKWIHGVGITPDVKVELDEKNPTKDTQLEKAMEILSK